MGGLPAFHKAPPHALQLPAAALAAQPHPQDRSAAQGDTLAAEGECINSRCAAPWPSGKHATLVLLHLVLLACHVAASLLQ